MCVTAVEVHYELCVVCGQNVMREGTVRQCKRMFKMDEQLFTMKSESQQSVVNNDHVQRERQSFTMSEL
jgi:GTP cyclohydrolase I